jgi:hypothetical protein
VGDPLLDGQIEPVDPDDHQEGEDHAG